MNIVLLEPLGINDKLLNDFKEKLNKLNHNFTYYNSKPKDEIDVINRIKNQDIIMVANYPLTINELKTNPSLKYIAVAFTGLDHIPIEYCKNNNIQVSNASGYSTTSVSEQVIGMTLSLYRYLHLNNELTKEGKTSSFLGAGLEIKNKTVGIIGLGNIGLELARLFSSFNANVIYYSRTKKECLYQYEELDELLKKSDIISIHLPLNRETKNFINKSKIDLIKENAILINCSRGQIIDNEYLAIKLNENKIKGAAIDVFDYEPPLNEDYPLLNAKNVLLTPHTAFLTKEALIRRAEIEFDNIFNYLKNV